MSDTETQSTPRLIDLIRRSTQELMSRIERGEITTEELVQLLKELTP